MRSDHYNGLTIGGITKFDNATNHNPIWMIAFMRIDLSSNKKALDA